MFFVYYLVYVTLGLVTWQGFELSGLYPREIACVQVVIRFCGLADIQQFQGIIRRIRI